MKKISLIVPCYNEQEVLHLFYEEYCRVMNEMDYCESEVIFVNDGSKDDTLKIVKELAESDDRIKYISFSRNFGKEAAMYAGLKNASGDLVAFLDADLQDPPSLLPEMYKYIVEDGYDSVATRRATRKGEPVVRSFFARCFYKFINKISKTEIVDGARDFRLMNRKYVDALLELCEYNRFTKGLFGWVGFNTKWINYENVERAAGETKWSFWKLVIYSIEGIVAFSTAPLAIAAFTGILFFFVALFMVVFIIAKTCIMGDPVSGWPSMVCIIFFLSGIQLFCIGILGEYLAKTYLECKKRPIFISKEDNINTIKSKGINYNKNIRKEYISNIADIK